MSWFSRRKKPRPEASGSNDEVVGRELLDPDHHRASVADGDALLLSPATVRSNLSLAVERVELDIDTAISIEEDVIRLDELAAMVQLGMGGVLIADVANTAVGVMLARYPEELVRLPLPPEIPVIERYGVEFDDADVGVGDQVALGSQGRARGDAKSQPEPTGLAISPARGVRGHRVRACGAVLGHSPRATILQGVGARSHRGRPQ